MFTTKDMEKAVRSCAASNGLTFRRSKRNNLYVLVDRKTQEVLISNYTLNSAYCDAMSGYIDSYDKELGRFTFADQNKHLHEIFNYTGY